MGKDGQRITQGRNLLGFLWADSSSLCNLSSPVPSSKQQFYELRQLLSPVLAAQCLWDWTSELRNCRKEFQICLLADICLTCVFWVGKERVTRLLAFVLSCSVKVLFVVHVSSLKSRLQSVQTFIWLMTCLHQNCQSSLSCWSIVTRAPDARLRGSDAKMCIRAFMNVNFLSWCCMESQFG